MLSIFHAITDRLKALVVTRAALELESEFLVRDAERQAELLRQAARYEEEGLHGVAQQLRQQAETLNFQRPLASVLPALAHLQDTPPDDKAALPRLRLVPGDPSRPTAPPSSPVRKKKGDKP